METLVAERKGVLVRPATTDDLDWLVGQLRAFSHFFGSKHSLFLNDEFTRNGMAQMIDKHLVLVAYKQEIVPPNHLCDIGMGFIAGIVTPHMFNPTIRVLSETFWWVTPEHRGSRAGALLLDQFIAWGKEHADWICFALEARTPVKESALLKRGFHLQERAYLMENI